MVLGTPAPQFPFDPYYQSKLASSPKYMAGKSLNDMTAIIPSLIKQYQMNKFLQGITNPQPQSPTTAGVGGAQTPQAAGSTPSDPSSMIMQMMALDPESAATMATLGSKLAETKKTNMETTGMLPYQQASLAEQAQTHRDTDEARKLQAQIHAMMVQANIDQQRSALEERKNNSLTQNQIRAQAENAKHPFINAYRSFRGWSPMVPVPGLDDNSSGWSPAEEKRLQELTRRNK